MSSSKHGSTERPDVGSYSTDQKKSMESALDITTFRHLNEVDPEGGLLLRREMTRDLEALNLSAPESYMSQAVREALAAPLPPSEGYPDRRFHSGRHIVNEIEELCWRRALKTFNLSSETWGVNVQAFSGSLANLYTYTAMMEPGESLLYMELPHGGHLSHGHQTPRKKLSETAYKFRAIPYHVDLKTGIIDYEGLRSLALQHQPKVITIGGSSYSRLIDYEAIRKIADDTGSILHCDMAHFCGLVAGGAMKSPFPFCDVVTTTTYKSFCGPKGAIIFYKQWMKDRINSTVFPRYQAARDYSVILAISVALLEAQSQEYRLQQNCVVESSRVLAASLKDYGYTIVGGGTDSHMVLIDLKDKKIEAAEAEKTLELVNIICNQNSIPGDKAGVCSGLRLGTPPMVIRGMLPAAFKVVAGIIHQALEVTRVIHNQVMQGEVSSSRQPSRTKFLELFVEVGKRNSLVDEMRSQVSRTISAYPPPWRNLEDSKSRV